MALSDTAIKAAKTANKAYKLSDEKGLFLLINPNGSKWWRLKYRFAGKEKQLSLGTYPDVSLKKARAKREAARELLENGADPSAQRKAEKLASQTAAKNSFEAIAIEWFTQESPHWSASHRSRVERILKKDLFPYIGFRPIGEITPPELLAALRRVESRGAIATARRGRQNAGQVFRFAVATGRAERDPSQDLAGALATPIKTHLPSVTEPKEVGPLLNALEGYQGSTVVCSALRLAPLTFVRPSELRNAKWADMDLEAKEWRFIVTKTNTQHIVPLSKQALAVLHDLQPLTCKSEYVFPSARSNHRPMSDNAVLSAMRRMDIAKDEMCGHGFRAMARTILDEVLNFRTDWIEHQLAHAVRDANGRAYNRTAHLAGRKKMMQAWADYLDDLKAQAKSSNVVLINTAR
ncbi:MAG: integrase arm-type DNA-binding domain-containing protein [Alcanivoracaceae bacterium]|nr:integrase arm-type DNA-binding domain-containing protein [Alcanivoracaceae bacterium]